MIYQTLKMVCLAKRYEAFVRPIAVRLNLGLTGLEPVTLRLSSACSNQLSYRPELNGLTPVSCVIAGN